MSSILCLNCQGLGETQTVDRLRGLLRRYWPKVTFLSETKKSATEMELLRPRLGNYAGVYVDSRRGAGGLAILWEKDITLNVCSSSLNHIDATICWEGENVHWRFTGIYGYLESHNKHKTGALLADLKAHSDSPWIIGGDLNEIFYHSEKKRGPPKPQLHIDMFQEAFIDNDLFELEYEGYDFTWSRWMNGEIMVEEHLDRFCASTDWSMLFPEAKVYHIDSDISDHLPLLMKCRPRCARSLAYKK